MMKPVSHASALQRCACLLGAVALFACASSRYADGSGAPSRASGEADAAAPTKAPNSGASSGGTSGGAGALDAGHSLSGRADVVVAGKRFADVPREIRSESECPHTLLSDEFEVDPLYICPLRPDGSGDRECVADLECMSPADCAPMMLSSCAGAWSSQCTYPLKDTTCTEDSDCTELPYGLCFEPNDSATRCYPSGECVSPKSECHYYQIVDNECDSDSDCNVLPGGQCAKKITNTQCQSDRCRQDADCDRGQRCACALTSIMDCFDAACGSDADCGDEQVCQRDNPCGLGAYGAFHCTTPADECRTDLDCTNQSRGLYCDFDAERFVCSSQPCGD